MRLVMSNIAGSALCDSRQGKNKVHRLDGLFRQSVFGRLARYEDVNDADRLALDPLMRQVVGGRAVDAQAASASQMGRFETGSLALSVNRAALADLIGQWIDRFHDRTGLKHIVLDMDSSVSQTCDDQEGIGFIVTNLPMEPDWVVRFYNQRGTAEQHIKEGKHTFRWTRLSCRRFRDNEVRLQLHALAYNLATFLRCIELSEEMADWSLTSLQLKLIKIGARVVRYARAITFQLAEVVVTGPMVRVILAAIHRLRAPPSCA
jgi:hypothetical protein